MTKGAVEQEEQPKHHRRRPGFLKTVLALAVTYVFTRHIIENYDVGEEIQIHRSNWFYRRRTPRGPGSMHPGGRRIM